MQIRGPQDIGERSFAYALRAIKLFEALKKRGKESASIIGRQYLRSATSVGANIEEARGAESRADFIHKHSIALKEARESLYWLRLLSGAQVIKQTQLEPLMKETEEIVCVLTSLVKNARANHPPRLPRS